MSVAFVGLGSNLGDPVRQVREALAELGRMPHTRLVKSSSLYRSAPVGYAAQPAYVNAVAQLETGLPAERLLGELQEVERQHGRERSFANAPRTLDLDLLVFEDLRIKTETLTVPHPRMHERRFVLEPLAEIADVEIPGKGRASALLGAVKDQAVEKLQ
ncbi:MAG: 2-amino-4-hydroxy-6-hydroxymethyldihydropteridine diphosphokinase [Clostridia bacterium]